MYGMTEYGTSEYGRRLTLIEVIIAVIVWIIKNLLGGRK